MIKRLLPLLIIALSASLSAQSPTSTWRLVDTTYGAEQSVSFRLTGLREALQQLPACRWPNENR